MINQTLANSTSPLAVAPEIGVSSTRRLTMKLLRDVSELESMTQSWEQLIEASVEPNPFFDPDFLIPAIHHFGNDNVYVLVVTAQTAESEDREIICGLLPVCERKHRGRKQPSIEIWTPDSNFDSTPLIRKDVAKETLEFILNWLEDELGVSSLAMNSVAGDGGFSRVLSQIVHLQDRPIAIEDQSSKLCFRPRENTVAYIASCVDESTKQTAQASYRKLCERGDIATSVSAASDAGWVESFLRLEASGIDGDATNVIEKHAAGCFFRAIADRMLPKGKMVILKTTLTGQPIAMSCEISHRNGGNVLYRQAVIQSLQKLNPGMILQFENLQRLHDTGVESCTCCLKDSEDEVFGVWQERKSYSSIKVSLRNEQLTGQRKRAPVLKKIGSYFRR